MTFKWLLDLLVNKEAGTQVEAAFAKAAKEAKEKTRMLEYHDRLDLKHHVEEHLDNLCGSLKYIIEEVPGSAGSKQIKKNADGSPVTEKAYCGPDCPTLKADILKGAQG